MDGQTADTKKKRFLWGALLAWIPLLFFLLPTIVAMVSAFSRISGANATGLTAIAGGFAELLSTFGLAAAFVVEIAAVVLLLRTFSKEHPMRSLVSVLSICCSGLMITVLALFSWLFFFRMPHS
jgi:hypothetical protein